MRSLTAEQRAELEAFSRSLGTLVEIPYVPTARIALALLADLAAAEGERDRAREALATMVSWSEAVNAERDRLAARVAALEAALRRVDEEWKASGMELAQALCAARALLAGPTP